MCERPCREELLPTSLVPRPSSRFITKDADACSHRFVSWSHFLLPVCLLQPMSPSQPNMMIFFLVCTKDDFLFIYASVDVVVEGLLLGPRVRGSHAQRGAGAGKSTLVLCRAASGSYPMNRI